MTHLGHEPGIMNRYVFLNDCNHLGSMFIDREGRKVQGAPEPAGEPVRRHLEAAAAFREILEAKPRWKQGSFSFVIFYRRQDCATLSARRRSQLNMATRAIRLTTGSRIQPMLLKASSG